MSPRSPIHASRRGWAGRTRGRRPSAEAPTSLSPLHDVRTFVSIHGNSCRAGNGGKSRISARRAARRAGEPLAPPLARTVADGATRRSLEGTTMNAADTSWMLVSTALVLLMTPALAFFYGGLVRSKNALNTMMMSFISLGFVGVLWAVVGYSLAFAPGNNYLGDLSRLFLRGVGPRGAGHDSALPVHGLPGHVLHHHGGAHLGRDRRAHALLGLPRRSSSLWALVVYAPVAHWVWGGGWLADMGALDFAGGTVVHVNAGVAALVAAIVRRQAQATIRARRCCRTTCRSRCSAPACSGSAGSASTPAARSAASPIAGARVRRRRSSRRWARWSSGRCSTTMRTGKPTAVGAATAIVVGLVAVTPAAGFVGPMSAIALGAIAAVPSYFGLVWRAKTSLDDSLDVVAAHGVGGTVGALLTGVFAQKALNGIADGAAVRQPGAARHSGDGRRRDDRLQRRRQLRPAQAHRPGHPAARRRPTTKTSASTSATTAKRPTCTPPAAARQSSRRRAARRRARWEFLKQPERRFRF